VVLATKSTLGILSLSHIHVCLLLLGSKTLFAQVALLTTVKTHVAIKIGIEFKQTDQVSIHRTCDASSTCDEPRGVGNGLIYD